MRGKEIKERGGLGEERKEQEQFQAERS